MWLSQHRNRRKLNDLQVTVITFTNCNFDLYFTKKSCIVLVIMSAMINFKTNYKDVLAEVLLNKKKKPELAKVYAKNFESVREDQMLP